MRKTHLMVLAIVAVAVVLAVGAVSAYADITTDSQAPVTTTDAGESYWNAAAITATATDNEGIAYIYHELDGGIVRLAIIEGGPESAETTMPTANDLPLSAGTHTIRFWAQDVNGNVEERNTTTFTVAMDDAAPATTATGATDGSWHKTGVTVHLEAADGADESGVSELSYAVDGGAPIVTASVADVSIPAVAGAHTIVYYATDVAGNAEAEKTLSVGVDTAKPVTSASSASVIRGRNVRLRYKVADALPNAGTAKVVIKVRNSRGKVVKTLKAGSVTVNAAHSVRFRCRLAKGTYRFSVYATDVAGNTQSTVGSARLRVK